MKFKELLEVVNVFDNIKVYCGKDKYQGMIDNKEFCKSLEPLFDKEIFMINCENDYSYYQGFKCFLEVTLNE